MKVLLGVSGGIAAYKAAELVRALQHHNIAVQVAMTASAEQFIQPLTFAALTGKPVFTSLWQSSPAHSPTQPSPALDGEAGRFAIESASFQIDHIAVAQQLDALVIAPATANLIAKLAHGIADDFLTTLYLATTAPVLVAPAMNVNMWNHPATQANRRILESRGVQILPPDAGYLACGMTGSGRLADTETIANAVVERLVHRPDLAAESILITAGGTREPIDPVRFLGNRSSGKMGHALAEQAHARGASVTLITASQLPVQAGIDVIRVDTAAAMSRTVLDRLPQATVVIKAAAVADFRVQHIAAQKLRRYGMMTLQLEATEDIVAQVIAKRRPGTLVIAFAAETENLESNARAKLIRKGADAIVANDVTQPNTGFDSDANAGLFLTATETIPLPESSKRAMADRILDRIPHLRANDTEKDRTRMAKDATHRG